MKKTQLWRLVAEQQEERIPAKLGFLMSRFLVLLLLSMIFFWVLLLGSIQSSTSPRTPQSVSDKYTLVLGM
jgi:cytoskeletal protein RodZ